MDINLDYYRIFYHVGKLGQITLAAKALSLTQPAVSQAIHQLESQLNTRLFQRTPKGVTLTQEGKLLYEYTAKGYELIRLGERELHQMQNLDTGEIHIGASDMTLRFYLLPYLEKFHEQYPGVKVSVTNAPTPETLSYLEGYQIDFGVISSPLSQHESFSVHPVREIHDIFVGGSRFAPMAEQTLSKSALLSLPLICLEKSTSTRHSMDEWFAKDHLLPRPEFELATSDMIVQFAIRNLGIGFVMKDFAAEYLKTGELVQFSLTDPLPSRHFCIVTVKNRYTSPAAMRLLEMLLE